MKYFPFFPSPFSILSCSHEKKKIKKKKKEGNISGIFKTLIVCKAMFLQLSK